MGPDVSLTEAAATLNLSPDTIVRRIRTGTLTGHKDAGGRWRVMLPPVAEPAEAGSANAEHNAEVVRLRAELDGVRETLAEVRRHRDSLTEELEARRREVAELHVLLQQRQLPPPVAVPVTPSTPLREPPAPRPPRSVRGWRARLARWLLPQ